MGVYYSGSSYGAISDSERRRAKKAQAGYMAKKGLATNFGGLIGGISPTLGKMVSNIKIKDINPRFKNDDFNQYKIGMQGAKAGWNFGNAIYDVMSGNYGEAVKKIAAGSQQIAVQQKTLNSGDAKYSDGEVEALNAATDAMAPTSGSSIMGVQIEGGSGGGAFGSMKGLFSKSKTPESEGVQPGDFSTNTTGIGDATPKGSDNPWSTSFDPKTKNTGAAYGGVAGMKKGGKVGLYMKCAGGGKIEKPVRHDTMAVESTSIPVKLTDVKDPYTPQTLQEYVHWQDPELEKVIIQKQKLATAQNRRKVITMKDGGRAGVTPNVGTTKSDSIKTTLPVDSHVIPAENVDAFLKQYGKHFPELFKTATV